MKNHELRVCLLCNEPKILTEFPKGSGKDGRIRQCKSCVSLRHKREYQKRRCTSVCGQCSASYTVFLGSRGFCSSVCRFWSKVMKGPGCWEWQNARDKDGYGVFFRKTNNMRAHRFAYELVKGPIHDDLLVLHQCDNPTCVRPDHLFVGTQKVNIADSVAKGRHTSVLMAARALARTS